VGDDCVEVLDLHRLGHIAVHTCDEITFPIAVHRMRRHGDDGDNEQEARLRQALPEVKA
jgi:hypothetical protein